MTSDETETLRYRLDTDTYEAIKYDIVPATERWDSVSEFTRASIQNQVKQLDSTASGGREANKLIRRLSDIAGIDERVPETATKPKIEGQTLDRTLSVSLTIEDFGLVNNVVDKTDLNQANTAGYCIFRQISRGNTPRDRLDDWYEQEVHQTWTELKNSLVEPQLRLHSVLTKRFRIQDTISQYIRYDLNGFKSFAEVYHEDIYGTDQYDDLKEIFGTRTLNDVENTIEEYTEYEFESSKKDSEFLEGCFEE